MSSNVSVGGGGEREIDALFASYACGAVSRPLAALIESHLELRPENRAFVAALEGLGGEEIEQAPPRALSDASSRLRAILDEAPDASEGGESAVQARDEVLPAPLRDYLGHGLEGVRWRWLMPGLRECKLPEKGVSLLWAKAGSKMPSHTHEGVEVTLVITGAFADATGRYGRGDIEIGDDSLDHQPIVDKDADCICFVVAEGSLHLTGPFGRWLDKLQRH